MAPQPMASEQYLQTISALIIQHRFRRHISIVSVLHHWTTIHMVADLSSGKKPVIELQFDQIKHPAQHMNFICAVLGKPFMPTYLYGKDSGRLSVLIS